jgi:hypothetical protein
MLRMKKLIENSSLFRTSLEGRFALDIMRTVLQTSGGCTCTASDLLAVGTMRAARRRGCEPGTVLRRVHGLQPIAATSKNERAPHRRNAEPLGGEALLLAGTSRFGCTLTGASKG